MISFFFVNKYAIHGFWLLTVNVLHIDYTCSVSSSISLTCSLRCIITLHTVNMQLQIDIKLQVCPKLATNELLKSIVLRILTALPTLTNQATFI